MNVTYKGSGNYIITYGSQSTGFLTVPFYAETEREFKKNIKPNMIVAKVEKHEIDFKKVAKDMKIYRLENRIEVYPPKYDYDKDSNNPIKNFKGEII